MMAFDRLQLVPLPSGSTFKLLKVLFSTTAENLQAKVGQDTSDPTTNSTSKCRDENKIPISMFSE